MAPSGQLVIEESLQVPRESFALALLCRYSNSAAFPILTEGREKPICKLGNNPNFDPLPKVALAIGRFLGQ